MLLRRSFIFAKSLLIRLSLKLKYISLRSFPFVSYLIAIIGYIKVRLKVKNSLFSYSEESEEEIDDKMER